MFLWEYSVLFSQGSYMGYKTLSQWSLYPNFQSFGRGDWASASTRQPLVSYSRDIKTFSLADYEAFKKSGIDIPKR